MEDESRSAAAQPAALPATVFRIRGVTKIYHMGEVDVHALRGVDLDLFESEFTVLLGPSGSGKSTLLNILGGLDTPSGGVVHYRDHVLTDYDDNRLTRFRRRNVGFVFQFYNLIPSLTARENVALITESANELMAAGEVERARGKPPGSCVARTTRPRSKSAWKTLITVLRGP